MPNVVTQPVSDKITRERTFEIMCQRDDKQDAFAQMVITLHDIVKKGFVGQLILNCNGSGTVSSIKVIETQKV